MPESEWRAPCYKGEETLVGENARQQQQQRQSVRAQMTRHLSGKRVKKPFAPQ